MRIWKNTKRNEDLESVKNVNKQIRTTVYNDRKGKIRREIKPCNQKSLWTSVKIAKDEETNQIPTELHLGDDKFKGPEVPEAFAKHFNEKVQNIESLLFIQTSECL